MNMFKKLAFVLLSALFLLALPALAIAQSAAAPSPAPSLTPGFSQWDLGTYFGLSAAVVAVIGLLKKLVPTWVTNKEPYLGLALSYILGIATKLFVPGSYANVNWVIFLLSLLGVAAGAKFGHDHLLNEIIKGGKDGTQAPPPGDPGADATPGKDATTGKDGKTP